MKIKNIEYYNFRNFAEQGKIDFSTDGKITIIYGTNGDGKTTLHQLFQWILYGRVNFNRTTSAEKLYNLEKGKRLTKECFFKVWGQIEFEHNGENYLVRREWVYNKSKNGDISHKFSEDEFYVQKIDGKGAGKNLDKPNIVIEEVLPSGLAPYFFFDGETMIADLKIKGTDSARTLKTALYSIFELEIYEKALTDIGSTSRSQSAIGNLTERKRNAQEKTAKVSQKQYIKEIKILSGKLEQIENENMDYKERLENYDKRIKEISEAIGTNKSRKQLERNRALLKNNIEQYNNDIKKCMLKLGTEVSDNYSYLLMTNVVRDAGNRIYMQVQDQERKIIPGLTKELLISLLKDAEHRECICGREIGREEIISLEKWKQYFPPASYKSTYDKFSRQAIKFSGRYDENRLLSYFKDVLEFKNRIRKTEEQMSEIDKELRSAGNIDELLSERRDIEEKLVKVKREISRNDSLKGEFEHQKNIRERAVENVGHASAEVQRYERFICLLERASSVIKGLLNSETGEYSQMLKI